MSYNPNLQHSGISEEELKAQHRQKELFSFDGHLARKGAPKSYTVDKRPVYQLNYLAIVASNLLRIAAAFLAVFFFFKGLFAVTGSASDYIAGIGAAILLVALEYRQWMNATKLLEKYFFKNTVARGYVVWAVFLSAFTLGLSLWGLPHSVAAISTQVKDSNITLRNELAETADLRAQIAASEKEANEFKTSASWRGKLDPADRKKYNDLLLFTQGLRNQLNEKTGEVQAANAATLSDAREKKENLIRKKMENDNKYVSILVIILLGTEILFWLGFYHKERYEFFAYCEAVKTGKIKTMQPATLPNQPVPQNGRTAANGQKVVDLGN